MNNFFSQNIWLKLSSLVFAIILWFFVILSGRTETSMKAPVSFINLPPGLEIMDSPKTVSVVIEGQERLLRSLRQNEISATIDLSNTRAGKVFVTLTKDNIIIPKMLTVSSIDPETISLKIESQLMKSVPVKPAVVGLPQKGFAIVEISVVPAIVALEGPKSAVAKVSSIKTEPIDINGINADLTYKANLNLTDTNIKKNVSKVEVNITVKKID
jgi:YbbR domain-containing protein